MGTKLAPSLANIFMGWFEETFVYKYKLQLIFKVERYKNCKYKNSPYYKGADIWKSLPLDISDSDCMFQFKKGIKRIYKKYNNIYV